MSIHIINDRLAVVEAITELRKETFLGNPFELEYAIETCGLDPSSDWTDWRLLQFLESEPRWNELEDQGAIVEIEPDDVREEDRHVLIHRIVDKRIERLTDPDCDTTEDKRKLRGDLIQGHVGYGQVADAVLLDLAEGYKIDMDDLFEHKREEANE